MIYYLIPITYPSALEHINQVIVLHPWFTPALTEKARVLVHAGEWEQAMESAQRIISQVEEQKDSIYHPANLLNRTAII